MTERALFVLLVVIVAVALWHFLASPLWLLVLVLALAVLL